MQLVRKLPTGSQQLLLQALGERPFLWGEESLPVLQLLVSQVRPVGVLGVTEQYEIKEIDIFSHFMFFRRKLVQRSGSKISSEQCAIRRDILEITHALGS